MKVSNLTNSAGGLKSITSCPVEIGLPAQYSVAAKQLPLASQGLVPVEEHKQTARRDNVNTDHVGPT